jgi:amphi-Trp domain-containing protein
VLVVFAVRNLAALAAVAKRERPDAPADGASQCTPTTGSSRKRMVVMNDETNDAPDDEDDEKTLFESEQQLPVAAVARRLREVAEGLDAGTLKSGGQVVSPASTVKFEEEYSSETTDEGIVFELELELKWSAAADVDHGSRAAAKAAGVAGKFELYKDVGGKFRFRLKAGNGQIIASSEAYQTKAAALNGIKSVRTNAPTGSIDDQT